MPVSTPAIAAEAAIFAIHSAIRLSRNIQRAYAQSLQGRMLVLPLPAFDNSIDLTTIIAFFEWSPQLLNRLEDLRSLHQRAMRELQLPEVERQRYEQYYLGFRQLEEGRVPELNADDLQHLFRVRQWQEGYLQRDSALKLVLGTVVEIGIDYFAQVPGALNTDMPLGQALMQILSAFDDIDWTDAPPLQTQFSQRLIPRLFAAAAETLAELSPQISGDEKVQLFLRQTARRIAEDLYAKAEQARFEEQEEMAHWGQFLLRSAIRHAGALVAENPQAVFNTNYPVGELIGGSLSVLLQAVLGEDGEQGPILLKDRISLQALDELVAHALSVVAQRPGFIVQGQGLQILIAGTARALQQHPVSQIETAGLLRLALEQAAGYLAYVQQGEESQLARLWLQALEAVLQALASASPISLSRAEIMDIVQGLLDEVLRDPAWIAEQAAGKPVLSAVLEINLRALRALPPGERLRPGVFRWLLHLSLRAVANSPEVLSQIRLGSDAREAIVLEQALQLVFASVYRSQAPRLNRALLLENLLEYTLETLIIAHPDRKGLVLLELALFESGLNYQQGFDQRLAEELTDAALAALANHPELVSGQGGVQAIISGLARALDRRRLREPGLLSFLLRHILELTGAHAHLLIDADTDQPKHLLVTATQEILEALTQSFNDEGQWRPGLSPVQAVAILEALLEEVVLHPYWLDAYASSGSLLRQVVDSVLSTLEAIPTGQRLSGENLELVLEHALYTTARSPQLLARIQFASDTLERSILEHALQLLWGYLFPKGTEPSSRLGELEKVAELLFDGLLERYPDKRGLILADLILFGEYGAGLPGALDEAAALRLAESAAAVLHQYPGLVARHQGLRLLVRDLAGALEAYGLAQPGLLPEAIRLTLETTALHLHLFWPTEEEEPVNLLVIALEQTLRALSEPPSSGKWKPRLSQEQLLDLLEILYQEIAAHPAWIAQEPWLYKLLLALFRALEHVPARQPLPYETLRALLLSILDAVNLQQRFLFKVQQPGKPEAHLLIHIALDDFFILLYGEYAAQRWHLSQRPILTALLDYFLSLAGANPSPDGVADALAQLRAVIDQWQMDFRLTLSEVLAELGKGNLR